MPEIHPSVPAPIETQVNNQIITIEPAVLDFAAVCNYVALSESTIQKLVRQSEFPKPRQLSGRRVGWLRREVDEWAESRPVADLLPPINCSYGTNGKET